MDLSLKSIFNPDTFFEHGWVNIPKTMIEEIVGSSKKPCSKLEALLIILLHVNYSGRTYNVNGKSIYCERGESVRSFSQWAEILRWSRSTTKRFFLYLQNIGYLRFINDSEIHTHFIILPYEELMTGPNTYGTHSTPHKNTSHSDSYKKNEKDIRNQASNNTLTNSNTLAKSNTLTDCKTHADKENLTDKISKSSNTNSCNSSSNTPPPFKLEKKNDEIKTLQQRRQEFMVFWNRYFRITEQPRKNIRKAECEWNRLPPEEQRLAVENIGKYYYSQGNTRYILGAANYLAYKAYLNDFYY